VTPPACQQLVQVGCIVVWCVAATMLLLFSQFLFGG